MNPVERFCLVLHGLLQVVQYIPLEFEGGLVEAPLDLTILRIPD